MSDGHELGFDPIIFTERAAEIGATPIRVKLRGKTSRIRPGFRMLFYSDWTPVTIVNCYLHDFIRPYSGSSWVNTQKDYNSDCTQFTVFLAYRNKRWEDTDWLDVLEFSELNQNGVSARTRRQFERGTALRRVSTVIAVLKWAYEKKLIPHRVVPEGGLDEVGEEEALPRSSAKDAKVNRIPEKRFQQILAALGPSLEKARNWNPDVPSMAKRLAATTALATGMRIAETLSMTVTQLVNLEAELDDEYPDKLIELKILQTKGKPDRIVIFPSVIVKLLSHYVSYERTIVQDAAVARGKRRSELTQKIFLNSLDCNNRDVGNALTPDFLSRTFRKVVIALGFLRDVTKFKFDGSEQPYIEDGERAVYIDKVNAYSFHDLRHTFTAFMAELLSSAGKGDIWKTMQMLLGHEHSDTTRTIYGRHVKVNGSAVSDAVSAWLAAIDKTFGSEK
ncbi:tyrosine-type recombinase/integrase [Rhizobium sp. SU303]|uniref:tyrosine-type recombinase/integrase n=1 Tax=Rhizobium sp. SU303 TaxID=3138065 RepID=UPI001E3C74D8|nr:tyrosine-type recombinase/integrase [Rhizobium leguminosarum]UFW79642.1 tyrosine-type recombinase/integrase [Rhizobium leguminosarum bv. viciae]